MITETARAIDPYRSNGQLAQADVEQEFGFADLLDVVNPLQHLPVIGWIYRGITGDKMGAPAAIAGGALYGGPIGFAGAILAAAFDSLSGDRPEDLVADALSAGKGQRAADAYSRAAALAEG
jgi:hypothetical protein